MVQNPNTPARQNDNPRDDLNSRVRTLEEHAGFQEHAQDQLAVQVAELLHRVSTLQQRLDRLEIRITQSDRHHDEDSERHAFFAG